MPSSTLRNATDSYVTSAVAAKNYGATSTLQVQSTLRFAFVFFNRAAPLGATITSAKLRLYQSAAWPANGARTVTIRRVGASWAESRIKWNNRPGVTGTAATTPATGGPVGQLIEVDVTSLMQSVSDGAAWYGFRLETNEGTPRPFVSSEGKDEFRPTLEVSWTEAPDAPTTLVPSGGRAVTVSKPILRFDFTDELGDTALQSVQVQIDSAADWVTPEYDSGWIDTSTPEIDLSSADIPAYAGLANGSSTFWRVRVRDGAGLDSAWSDDESFSHVDFAALAITNPPADELYEPTPPILWSYAGTQTAWQVIISDAADPSKVIVDSGKQSSDETAWTVPKSKLTKLGYPYQLDVHVWDDVEREAVGSPVFAVATRVFTVEPVASVTPVSALTVGQPDARPRVRLTWTRSTAPDKFVVRRDGVAIEDELLPEDALVAGTSYAFDDDDAQRWRDHTWDVAAVVNNEASTSSSVDYMPTQRGIWLLDKQRGREVWIAGQEQGTFSRGEESSVFVPIGAKRVVRRVQGQRGYEGSISGPLVDQYGRTAFEYEADLLAMRDEPARPVTLSLGDMTLRVILGNVNTIPTVHTPPARVATFEFWETT